MEANNHYCDSAESFLQKLPDNFIDLNVTSPPYGSLRKYHGFSVDLDLITKELLRATKPGGVCVWVVGDQTKNGSEDCSSFRSAIKFVENGWRLHDTMIYKKLNPPPNAGTRYQQCFEYMFVFSKGSPKTANIQLRERRNKCNDKRTYRKKKFSRNADGVFNTNDYYVKEQVPKDNIWEYLVGGGNSAKDKLAFKHPAIFPIALAADHINTWTNKGDVVSDIMCGSGQTLIAAGQNERKFIGCDLSQEYCDLTEERLKLYFPNGYNTVLASL